MKNSEFIAEIIKLYHNSRNSKFPDKKVTRGRSSSNSAYAEDLFAKFIVSNIKCDRIFIDQPLNVDSLDKMFYPDITVLRNGEIVATCDLKMDMGWMRDKLELICDKSVLFVKKARGKNMNTNILSKDGINKGTHTFKFSSDFSHNIVVISGKNISDKRRDQALKNVKSKSPIVDVFVLSGRKHPNEYGYTEEHLLREILVLDDEFEKLKDKLKK